MLLIDALVFFLLSLLAHLVVAVPVVIIGYKWGKKQGEASYQAAKREIKEYVRTELLADLTTALKDYIRNEINGIFGPIGKGGTAEARAVAAQYAQQNPGILQLLTGVAAKSGLKWAAKQLGAPKEVVETFSLTGDPQAFFSSRRGSSNPDLEPVKVPGGP